MLGCRFLIAAVGFCLLVAGCAVNPVTGEKQFMLISESQDIQIGQKYAPEITRQMGGVIANQTLQNYINNVGQTVARTGHRPEVEYHFQALNDESTNAFALPGGYVFVTRGMLEKLTSEAQLAGILAHEVVHIVARHAAEAMSWQIGVDMLLSAVASENTPQGVLTVANIGRQIVGLKFSREDEMEADSAGLDYMAKAGYNPYGMVETMQILQQADTLRPIEFLSTHPSPANRTAALVSKIQRDYYNPAALKIGREDYRRYALENLE
jgi:predicted Zn-dependent protease